MDLNTVYCGDCLDVMRQMEDNSVDLVLTDPPYYQVMKQDHAGISMIGIMSGIHSRTTSHLSKRALLSLKES